MVRLNGCSLLSSSVLIGLFALFSVHIAWYFSIWFSYSWIRQARDSSRKYIISLPSYPSRVSSENLNPADGRSLQHFRSRCSRTFNRWTRMFPSSTTSSQHFTSSLNSILILSFIAPLLRERNLSLRGDMFLCGRRLKLSIAIERLLASVFLAIKQGREVGWRSGWVHAADLRPYRRYVERALIAGSHVAE